MVLFPHPSIPETVENINSPFKILPRVDQSKFFDSVYQHLGKGQCIGIFPEVFFFLLNLWILLKFIKFIIKKKGGSHDRTRMIELKPGVAIMALGALEKYGTKAKILPLGLNYDQVLIFNNLLVKIIKKCKEVWVSKQSDCGGGRTIWDP